MAKKYYAVRKGREIGIFTDWSECEKQIKGYSGAEFKSFLTQEEAQNYVNNTISTISTESNNNNITSEAIENNHTVQIYVDGSYSESCNLASFGYIILKDNNEIYRHYGIVDNPNVIEMRNVAGELAGVISALNWAKDNDITEVIIFYDYEGIEKWITGEWKTKKENTILYKKFIEEIRNKIDVIFIKVKAHSGNKYNELADTLAKNAILEKTQINHTCNTSNNLSDNKEFTIIDSNNNLDNLITFLQDTCKIETKEVQNGIQYIIKNNDEQFFITKYKNLKILFQGKPYRIYNDIIIFLSSTENFSNTIKKMNEEFYNFQSKDINLKFYLPKSYNIFPDMLFSIWQPSLLEQPTYTLQDYSMYAFPALRTLEGSIKYLLTSYGIEIDNKGLKCFDGYELRDKYRVKIQNKNNKLAEHIEKMYKYYKDNRHPLCHTTATLLDIKIIENYEDVKRIIREVLELLDEAFDLHNSNGLKQ